MRGLPLLLLFLSFTSFGQRSAVPGAQVKKMAGAEETMLLFKHTKTTLTPAQKLQVYRQLDLTLSGDRKGFVSSETPVEVAVYPVDLNGDGTEELFVMLSSTALYGNAGSGFSLFAKDKSGYYKLQRDIGGAIPSILPTSTKGYRDILAGGPGWEFPVYTWNGTAYTTCRTMKDAVARRIKMMDIEAFSKSYTDTIRP